MLARTLIFRVVRRSDRSGRRRSPREKRGRSNFVCLTVSVPAVATGDPPGTGPEFPTRFLTADVPESKEESHEVAGKGKSLRLRNRPRSHEGSGGRRTNVVEVRTRKITFPFSLRGLLSNRDWKEIQCRLPPTDATGDSLSTGICCSTARDEAQFMLLVRCAIAVTHQCC